MLYDAGLHRSQILCANVISKRPPGNNFNHFLQPSTVKTDRFNGIPIKPELAQGLQELEHIIAMVQPKLIIGCGNWPLWALTDHAKVATKEGFRNPSGIATHRGSQTYTRNIHGNEYPYLPIYHPAAILRDWSLRHISCHDLRVRGKAFIDGSLSWPEDNYNFLADGSFEPIVETLNAWLSQAQRGELWLCCDVETWKRRYLSVVGLCDGQLAIAIPYFYFDDTGAMRDVFTRDQELAINNLIRRLLLHPNVRITNQNYSYDNQFLDRYLYVGKTPTWDTMLAQHLLFPGTPKDLAYLASLYCSHYRYWKDESEDWDGKPGGHLQMWAYNCKDTIKTYEITFEQQRVVEKLGFSELMQDQLAQWEIYARVGDRGIRWDRDNAGRMRRQLLEAAAELSDWLIAAVPENLRFAASGKPWYDSPKHQQLLFYDRLGIQPILHKKSKRPTLDKESFETLKRRAPWLSGLFDNLKLLRSVNVFARNFLDISLSPNGRCTTSFNVGGTETFRLSSSANAFGEGMNLQNLPQMEE